MLKDALDLFEKWANASHLPSWIVDYVIKIGGPTILLLVLVSWLFKFFSFLIRYRNKKVFHSNLNPYYTDLDVYKSTRYYIQTTFQNVSPGEEEEPSRRYIAAAKGKLIPLLIRKVFNNIKNQGKFYIILADSGMGKTTLLINLFIRYKNSLKFFWVKRKFNIKLIPLAYSDCIAAINTINDKENTILLLDSLDENIDAVKNYQQKLKEILKASFNFKIVLITCRTQFFPTQKEEPYETGYFSFGESGEYKFQKIYLSPFSDKDIIRYLLKKFPLFNLLKIKKFFRAYRIVKKCPNLMVRPMLLNHIEDLVKTKQVFTH